MDSDLLVAMGFTTLSFIIALIVADWVIALILAGIVFGLVLASEDS